MSGHREQLNQVTAFLDASHTYGSDVCESRQLRAFVGGRLNVTRHPVRGKDLLPLTSEHKECKSPSNVCFTGGEIFTENKPERIEFEIFKCEKQHKQLCPF